ncbi:MAG: hypothetical protein FJ291_01510 [Planctomycetes bacterium]|nr:hypothetical protein [Planctomycetota bacterium]
MRKNVVVAISGLLFATALAGEGTGKAWNFDGDKPGAIAAGFTQAAGDWKAAADPTAPSKGNALAQTAASSGATFNIVLADATSYKDVDVSVKLRAVSGEVDQGGGLVWRAKDAKNYYIARYNPLEENYRVYKVVDGRRTQLGSANIAQVAGWRTLRVRMVGDEITCYFDGKEHLKATDATFPDAGQIGLWTKADAVTHFDDLAVAQAGPARGSR